MNSITAIPTSKSHEPSLCEYLFKQSAHEVFGVEEFEGLKVEEHLSYIREVEIGLLDRHKFYLIDPNALNNQCHLYALYTSIVAQRYFGLDAEKKKDFTADNRFLLLGFLCSKYFAKQEGILNKLIKHNKHIPPKHKKRVYAFLNKYGHVLTKHARYQTSEAMREFIKTALETLINQDSLVGELKGLLSEDLTHELDPPDPILRALFTYPKLPGVILLMKMLRENEVPLVVKIKVLGKEKNRVVTYVVPKAEGKMIPMDEFDRTAIKPEQPVITIEGIAAYPGYTMEQFWEKDFHACPNKSFGGVVKRSLHNPETPCNLCKPETEEVFETFAQQQKSLSVISDKFEEVMYCLGADFVQHMQKSYQHRLFSTETTKFPELTKYLMKFGTEAEEKGLCADRPTTFMIEHMFADVAGNALNTLRSRDLTPLNKLKMEGLVPS